MKVTKSNSKIYLAEWQKFKPYTNLSKTDVYYLDICNKVFYALNAAKNKEIFQKLLFNEVKELCCFLTSYFEDVISESNIWKAFTTKHLELYNKFVIFQNPDDYFENEINLDDIHFLIWYFVSLKNENSLISPYSPYIIDIVENIYDVFDEKYDYAPENEMLKNWYTLDPNETDYYKVRYFIEKTFFNNYLLDLDVSKRFNDELNNASSSRNDINLENALYAYKDKFLLETKSKLLALGANEWAALVLGKEHKLYNDLLNISKKIYGNFLFKNKIDNKYIYIEHIASGRKFDLLKFSFDDYQLLKNDDILKIGIVKWQNEWWFSGVSSISPFDADTILDEKNSVESRHQVAFLEDAEKVKSHLQEQSNAFLKFNNNLPVAFLKKEEISAFVNDFYSYYNKSLKLSTKQITDSDKRAKKDGLLSEQKSNEIQFDEDFETAILYFNPNAGIEFYFEICGVLDFKSNPYFDKNSFLNENLGLLVNDFYSTEFVNYCYGINKDKLNYLKLFSENELDFLNRFFKKNNYQTAARQTLI